MQEGWVKAHRALLDHPVMDDDWLCRLWLWCLLKANTKASRFREEQLAPGQFIAGRSSAAEQLHVSPSKWYRGMQRLAELGCVTLKANSNWTTITVCKWETYQARKEPERTADEQQVNSQRTASEQPANTEEEFKNTRMKEGKKKIHISYTTDFEEFWRLYPRRQGNPPQGKVNAFEQWRAILPDDIPKVMLALKHYTQTCNGYPKDPERFLKKEFWKDHLEPPTHALTTNGNRTSRNGTGQLYRPPQNRGSPG